MCRFRWVEGWLAKLEYGRLCKTEHGLRYLACEDYRRRIGAQLNKGEAIHALRRFLVFGNLARLTRRDTDALVNQAACLNLLTNAVIVWNTVYIARVIDELWTEGHEVHDEDIAHLSPARHEHINRIAPRAYLRDAVARILRRDTDLDAMMPDAFAARWRTERELGEHQPADDVADQLAA